VRTAAPGTCQSGFSERFRNIYGLRNRLRATRAKSRGVWVGWKPDLAEAFTKSLGLVPLLGRRAGRLKTRRVADQDGVFGPLDDLQDNGGPGAALSVRHDDAPPDKLSRKDACGVVARTPIAVGQLGRPPASQHRQAGLGWWCWPKARADHASASRLQKPVAAGALIDTAVAALDGETESGGFEALPRWKL